MHCDRCGRNLTLKNGETSAAVKLAPPEHQDELYPELKRLVDVTLCYVCVLNAYGLQPPVLI